MKYDFDQKLTDLRGEPLTLNEGDDEAVTLAWACKFALLKGFDPRKPPDEDEKYERYKVARKIERGGVVDLEDKERTLLRKSVGVCYGPEPLGIIWDLLDQPIVDDVAAE